MTESEHWIAPDAGDEAVVAALAEALMSGLSSRVGHEKAGMWSRAISEALAPTVARLIADATAERDGLLAMRERAREDGIRQAVEWLRADYEYGTGPEWREHGCEWILDRLAEERYVPLDGSTP